MILLDFADYAYRYGIVAGIIILIIRNRWLRKKIDSLLPPWAQSHGEVNKEYVDNQARIERKLDHIAERQGIVWPADILDTWRNVSVTKKRQWLRWSRRDMSSARSVGKYTNLNGGKKKMKSKMSSRKFWMAVVSALLVVLNEGLGLDVDSQTVLAFAGIVMTYIFGEAYVDSKRTKEANHGPDYSQASDTSDKLTI